MQTKADGERVGTEPLTLSPAGDARATNDGDDDLASWIQYVQATEK
jgi:hypothetical protein